MSSTDLDQFTSSTNLKAQAVTLTIFSALSITLIATPFVWHYRNRNLPACALILWLIIQNLITFVNAIIWPNDNFASWFNGNVLCDIEAKIESAIYTAVPCATVCIARNLASVLRVDQANTMTKKQRRRKLIVDCLILFLVPFLQVILHYIVQPNRYIIIAIGGCAPSFDQSWPTIVIMYIPPQIFALVTCYYCALILIRLRKYRSQFAHIIEASNSNLTTSRFLRLFMMCFSLIIVYTPVSLYLFYVNVNITWFPYSWSFIHDHKTWNTVLYLPFLGARTLDRWLPIAMSICMFFYLGLGSETIDAYRSGLTKLGLDWIWPSLAKPRSRQGSTSSSTGWMSKLSPIVRARKFFEARASRRGSDSELLGSAVTDTRSQSGSASMSLTGKKSMSSNVTDDRHLSGSTLTPSLHKPALSRQATLPALREHPSSNLPDFNNPFTDFEPEATTSSFPGISGTAAPRNGGLFGGHQGSSFNMSLPSMKFSPMNLFPSPKGGWKSWSRSTKTTSPDVEMSQAQTGQSLPTKMGNSTMSKAEERDQFSLELAAQYREGSVPGLNPGWGPTPTIPPAAFGSSSLRTNNNIVINSAPLYSNPTQLTPFPSQYNNGPQTKIYATNRNKERLGSAGSESSMGSGDEGVIQVRRKMKVTSENLGSGGVVILERDGVTGEVFESC